MSVAIREAIVSDYMGLCEIYSELDEFHRINHPELFVKANNSARTQEYIAERINDDDKLLLVAEKDYEIVGLVESCIVESPDFPMKKKRKWVQIDSLAVKSGNQNCNIGSLLLEKTKEWAKVHDINRIELKVYSFNNSAIQFYSNKGFKELSKTMVFDI